MKHIIITLALALATVSLNAMDIAKKVATSNNLTLELTGDQYFIRGQVGVIPLGNIKEAKSTLRKMETSYMGEAFELGETKFNVLEDNEGLYIIKVGLGVVKVRPEDATKFLLALDGKSIKDATAKGVEGIKRLIK